MKRTLRSRWGLGFIAISVAYASGSTWTSESLQGCVFGQTWCVYGDSTIEETIHDILVLLANMTDTEACAHFKDMRECYGKKHVDLGNGVLLDLANPGPLHGHRLMRATVPSIRFELRHVFTGHRDINTNSEGITALLYYLRNHWDRIAFECNVVIMNSAAHDWSHGSQWMAENYIPTALQLKNLAAKNCNLGKTCPRLYWKGNAHLAYTGFQYGAGVTYEQQVLSEYDIERTFYNTSITFINISSALLALPTMTPQFKIENGRSDPHIGQGGANCSVPGSLRWTEASTYAVLDQVCMM